MNKWKYCIHIEYDMNEREFYECSSIRQVTTITRKALNRGAKQTNIIKKERYGKWKQKD